MSKTQFAAPISEQIWDMKYRFKDADGKPIDVSVEDSWERIATDLASCEKDRELYENRFYDALEDWKYLPAGRITAGAGTGRNVTLFNCFVMGTVPDSMGGIFDMLKEAALTMQQGGGIGYDFSTLRPKGAPVRGVAADASGPLTFMDVWDAMCRTVMSAGSRRGAMMATMRCDHPDVLDFIHAKKDPTRLRMFNLSVLVTDDFMDAVKNDLPWNLHFTDRHGETTIYDTLQARDLWDAIMTSTYNQAEPGVIFIDRINQANNLNYVETIAATNPCGEQPLPPYGACLLGSINLARLIKNAFQTDAQMDEALLCETVGTAVRMMDNVVDVSKFPLEAQQQEAKAKRRIGLGVTGLADALLMLGQTYGSPEAAATTDWWMKYVAYAAYWASVELAKEKGAFPLFDADQFLKEGTHVHSLCQEDPELEEAIREHGIRNALLTSIAPTGTISLYAGNVSSGIEPVFAYTYTRKVLQKDGTKTEEAVEDYAFSIYRDMWERGEFTEDGKPPVQAFEPAHDLPPYFVSAQTLDPMAHVRMQAAAQKWVDSSISKTINVPEDISYEEFKEVYMAAWDSGCKGCTTYRPNDITGSVLSVEPENNSPSLASSSTDSTATVSVAASSHVLHRRPDVLSSQTYKIKFGSDHHAMYVTISDLEEDGKKSPYEIFINSKNMDHFIWIVALTRMISSVFRVSNDSTFVVEELKAVFDPKGGAFHQGKYVPSIVAAIGGIIERHMIDIGYIEGNDVPSVTEIEVEPPTGLAAQNLCPNCFGDQFKMESGCETCLSCGHSKCG